MFSLSRIKKGKKMKNLTMKMKSVIIKIVKTYKDSMSCYGEGNVEWKRLHMCITIKKE